ncbi:acetyltransferase (GNAT) family protein [Saccharothrix saharensis]|uniref:Acetyltransferase (GNAT) family protein n=1 Tax=Saccharothrix saharensis TaxID=571190 RepID=A0A543J6Y2_9PSEU|nr:GNAT family N-acetyltransferase [Saccharothrix saharensis]TQM78590.1 acetyltransferase (GNAT) family protein [Saccharothrix saharensis]
MSERGTGSDRPTVRRREWRTLSPADLRQIEAIWEESFPAAERGEHDSVSRRDSTWLWTADSPDGRLTGFATALALTGSGAAYLEYLAVLPSERGSGTGAALLAAIVDDLRAESPVRGIVLEVEDPIRTPGCDPMPARRVAFYERWGARRVASLPEYSMPDLANPGGLVPMVVLWRGLRDNPVLDRDGVVRVLIDLYHGYYAHAASEGHLQEVLDRMKLVVP